MRKLAVVGSHPATRGNAPFNNPEYEIWVLNEAPQSDWCKRWDVAFQLHKPDIYTSPHNRNQADHWEWLQKDHGERRIYMQEADPRVPCSVRYPLEDAIALTGERYFTSSLAYIAALIALLGYEYVEFYGSDLVSNTEYAYQAECFRYWLGFLRGRGINARMKCWPTAFRATLYGYEDDIHLGAEYYQERAEKHRNAWKSADKHLGQMVKALEGYFEKQDFGKIRDAVIRYQEAAIECGKHAGAMAEAEKYAGYGKRITSRQEFEHTAANAQRTAEEKRRSMYHMGGMIEYSWNVASRMKDKQTVSQLLEFLKSMAVFAYDLGAMLGMIAENAHYMGLYDKMRNDEPTA